ncbi:hypothetical protein PHMEG_00031047 [Phytophthora megakarya]|uniref:Uncharacterized protein n=1 Tax=Phytophthora megakarya TaxID=4795 RepID=A0A225UZ32_9STRA|nr:hypothetical protein PHMEG_00031047 [Phytophthora megakarya]
MTKCNSGVQTSARQYRRRGFQRVSSVSFTCTHINSLLAPSLPKGYDQLAGRCSLPVPFPADVVLRRDRKKLQRIREALELLAALATVNSCAFLHLLTEFVVVADHFDDIFRPDLIFVSPVWECYLVGRLDSEEVVGTWKELFGCGEDLMEYSEEFGVVMGKFESYEKETMKVLQDYIGHQTAVV